MKKGKWGPQAKQRGGFQKEVFGGGWPWCHKEWGGKETDQNVLLGLGGEKRGNHRSEEDISRRGDTQGAANGEP